MKDPPVKLMIRTGGGTMKDYKFRFENEWPLKRTQWTKLYLQAERKTPVAGAMDSEGTLVRKPPKKKGAISYSATGVSHAGVASASSTMLQAGAMHRNRHLVSNRTAEGKNRSHRPGETGVVGFKYDQGHGHVRHRPQHRPRRQGCLGSRAAGPAGTGGSRAGCAPRTASWIRN